MALCEACGTPIWFLRNNTTGKINPIEIRPHPDGNIAINLAERLYRIATPEQIASAKLKGQKRYISHFVTCPESKKFRRTA